MITKADKNKARVKSHLRVRKKINGTTERPRLYCIPFFQAYLCTIDR